MRSDFDKNNPEKTVPTGEDLVLFAVLKREQIKTTPSGFLDSLQYYKKKKFDFLSEENLKKCDTLISELEEIYKRIKNIHKKISKIEDSPISVEEEKQIQERILPRLEQKDVEKISNFFSTGVFSEFSKFDEYQRNQSEEVFSYSKKDPIKVIRMLTAGFLYHHIEGSFSYETVEEEQRIKDIKVFIAQLKKLQIVFDLQYTKNIIEKISLQSRENLSAHVPFINMLLTHLYTENNLEIITEKRRDAAKESAPPPKGANTQGKPKKLNF